MRGLLPMMGLAFLGFVGCGSSSNRSGFEEDPSPTDPTPVVAAPAGTFDAPATPPPAPDAPAEVFGHSATTLYKLDPTTKAVTVVGDFKKCESVIDIAVDETGQIFGASYGSLYKIDKTNASCTVIGSGSYPNSLSFVPKGTLDANEEALVGFVQGDYIRIDVKTGTTTKIGTLGGGLKSSGDVVSVKGGSSYLTVKGTSCDDCLVEIDPKTGAVTKNWGNVFHTDVFGLSFWAGKVYGFTETGELFEVTFANGSISTAAIAIPSKPSDLKFWGAGSTTLAPLVAKPQ